MFPCFIIIDVKDFYPRSPCGERPQTVTKWASSAKFLSTLSLRRATIGQMAIQAIHNYFYPRSPCGERLGLPVAGRIARRISIHALLAESDNSQTRTTAQTTKFLSTLSLRRATIVSSSLLAIHTISIHALLAESDTPKIMIKGEANRFLSTLSLRRATALQCRRYRSVPFLSTLSLRRATAADISIRRGASISIHALLAESDRLAPRA